MTIHRIEVLLILCGLALMSLIPAAADDSPLPALSETYESDVLQRWFDEEYLPSHDAPELIEKTAFVKIDVKAFKESILASISSLAEGATEEESALRIRLFPDLEYSLIPESFAVSRTGYSSIKTRVVTGDLTKRERFRFELTPDGRLSGYGSTSSGNFQIQPTAENGYFLVVKVNTRRWAQRMKID